MSDYDNDDDDDEEAATSSQLSKTPLPQQQPAPVDLRLAKTYLPGFMCLGRGTVIILIISRSPLSVPLILALATAMYVDRSIRTESIFDSNAMLGAIIASHALNVMRSDPEIHQELHLASGSGAILWGRIAQILQSVISIALLNGLDISWLAWKAGACDQSARASTIILNGVLLLGVLQTPVDAQGMLTSQHIIVRCYVYLALCLIWTYTIGVGEMVALLSSTTRHSPPINGAASVLFATNSSQSNTPTKFSKGNMGGGRHVYIPTVVQSFLPCHLRFTHLLLSPNSTHLFVSAGISGVIVAWNFKNEYLQQQQQQKQQTSVNTKIHPEYCLAASTTKSTTSAIAAPIPSMYVTYSPLTGSDDTRPKKLQAPASAPMGGGMVMAHGPISLVYNRQNIHSVDNDVTTKTVKPQDLVVAISTPPPPLLPPQRSEVLSLQSYTQQPKIEEPPKDVGNIIGSNSINNNNNNQDDDELMAMFRRAQEARRGL